MNIFGHVKHLHIHMLVLNIITLCLRGTYFSYCKKTWALPRKCFNICITSVILKYYSLFLFMLSYKYYKCRLYSSSNMAVYQELRIIKIW